MSTMKFANILLESNPRSVAYPGLYCRSDQPVVRDPGTGEWEMYSAGTYDFATYFNSLSVMKLRKYTVANSFSLHLELKGAACTVRQNCGGAFSAEPEIVEGTERTVAAGDSWQAVDMPLAVTDDMVLAGFVIRTEGRVAIRNSYYEVGYSGKLRDIELAVGTTTFKKENYITGNIDLIRKNIIDTGEDISRHFHMYVIDNGRTLDAPALSSERITVTPNDNVGGAGGFTRAMITAMEQEPKATNIILMDDDVAVSPESIKRTYNVLRLLKPEYEEAMISGAMLNYEVGEDQWEDIGHVTPEGYFMACKPPLRVTLFEDLVYNEKFEPTKKMKKDLYAAWWYCCIPVAVIEKNGLPLPYFVRCDDVEYGVRCKTPFITMNSLCVWHMSFNKRYNAAVERYQSIRNILIAQATTGIAPEADSLREMYRDIRLELKKFAYDDAELCLDAFEDFLKGPDFISKPGIAEATFMKANKDKEKLVDFETLQEQLDADPDVEGLQISDIDRQLIDGDKPRTLLNRAIDFTTDNWQHLFRREGKGYAVIPLFGWAYPAGVIRGKKKLIAIDWFNRKGAVREKDPARYNEIMKRYRRDMRYYKTHAARLRHEYEAARATITSVGYWKHYLKMD